MPDSQNAKGPRLEAFFQATRLGGLSLILVGAGVESSLAEPGWLSGTGSVILSLNFMAVVGAQQRGLLTRNAIAAHPVLRYLFRVLSAGSLALSILAIAGLDLGGVSSYLLFLILSGLLWFTLNAARFVAQRPNQSSSS